MRGENRQPQPLFKSLLPGFIFAITLLSSVVPARAAEDLSATLQRGLFEEEANNNLPAAIKAYEAVVSAVDAQRKLAGTALFRLAECQRKLGRTNEAVAFYQRVLREYPDQTRLAELSQNYLAASGRAELRSNTVLGSAGSLALTPTARAEQKRLFEEEIQILQKELDNLEALRKKGLPDEAREFTKKRELLALRRQVAALGVETVDETSRVAVSTPTDEEDKEVRRIQALIKDSPDLINASDGMGSTPLHRAAANGQLVVAKFLLANKANVNARTTGGRTPLHDAVWNGHKSMAELLLANGADVNARGESGWTPLQYAANRGHKAIVELLLANKANVNALDQYNGTPLYAAVQKGFRNVAEVLLEAGADLNVVKKASGSVMPDPSFPNSQGTPLHIAVSDRNKPLTELLLAHRADPNLRNQLGQTPLHLVENNVELATLLVAAKADVNARIQQSGNDLGGTPLYLAVVNDRAEMLDFLLANGADPNMRFSDGRPNSIEQTPLISVVARSNPNERIIKTLLEHKADTSAKSGSGSAPLHMLYHANKAVVELLLKHGADIEVRDSKGNTPLSGMYGSKDIIQLLLERKANPNAQDDEGDTPLHRLVKRTLDKASSQMELAELLLSHGADVHLRNRQGLTPLNLFGVPARPKTPSGVELAEVLRKHGAKDEQLDLVADPDSIRVWRKSMTFGRVVFARDDAGNNRFTLIEALLNIYNLRQTPVTGIQKPPAQARALGTSSQPFVAPPAPAPRSVVPSPQPGRANVMVPPQLNPTAAQPGEWTEQSYGANPAFTAGTFGFAGSPLPNYDPVNEFAFPDLTRIRILRQVDSAKAEKKVISVNLLNAAGIVLCNNDVLLEFGDIVEIPEREYRLDESRVGLTSEQSKGFFECLPKKIEVVVKGRSSPVKLAPIPSASYLASMMRMSSVRNVLRSTSDLSRLRITRRADPATGQTARELSVDLEAFQRSGKEQWDDLWLREGDVIEVPERE